MTNRHPSEQLILRFFEYEHLPEPLKNVAYLASDYAHAICDRVESDPELTAGLRKLLEAKDCFVRATVAQENRKKNNEAEGKPL